MRAPRLVLLTAALSLMLSGAAQAAPIGLLKQYRIPTANSQPRYIADGADGNRWFTESNPNLPAAIGRITPAGAVTEFGGLCDVCILNDIAQGPGDILYFTSNDPFLGRITTAGTVLPPIPTPNSSALAGNIAVDSARNAIWMTDFNNDVIWRFDIAAGTFTAPISAADPTDVAVDAAGGVWFTENNQPGAIGHFDGTTTTRMPIPSGSVPHEITVATDGDVWFTERFSPQGVGRLDPATNAITEFPLTNVGPQSIAAAPGGAVWFTQTTTGNAARIDDGGLATYVEGKAVKGSEPFGIVVAADGTPWYTETAANKIAELQLK